MYDVRNVVRFEVALLVSSLKEKELIQVLCSNSFHELELGLVDVIDLLHEIEREYLINIPDKYLITSLEDIVSLICEDSLPEPFNYNGSAPTRAITFNCTTF